MATAAVAISTIWIEMRVPHLPDQTKLSSTRRAEPPPAEVPAQALPDGHQPQAQRRAARRRRGGGRGRCRRAGRRRRRLLQGHRTIRTVTVKK